MFRISGVNINSEQQLEVALTAIYGVGRSLSRLICFRAGVPCTLRAKELSDSQEESIRTQLESYVVEGDLRREINLNIKRLMDIGSYRGFRHRRGLPVRGQRTRTNARTRKGPRRSAVGLKK
jgi:small subunit ribosomal protein S13